MRCIMLFKFDKNIVSSLLLSTAFIAKSPLQAMDDQKDQNSRLSIAAKSDLKSNHNSKPAKNTIGVKLDPTTDPFTLMSIAKEGVVQSIEYANNWETVARSAISFCERMKDDIKMSSFVKEFYLAVLTRFSTSFYSKQYIPNRPIVTPFSSAVDDLFSLKSNRIDMLNMHKAISLYFFGIPKKPLLRYVMRSTICSGKRLMQISWLNSKKQNLLELQVENSIYP